MKEAHYMDIPGAVLHFKSKTPAARYGIDRMQLIGYGISTENVEKLYWSLFVHSMGFWESVRPIT